MSVEIPWVACSLLEGHVLTDHRQQPLVRHHDHRVDVLAHLRDADLGLPHPLAPLEQERLGHDPDGERAHVPRELRDDRRRPGARAAAHAAGDEHKIRTLEHVQHVVLVLLDGLAADLGSRTRTEPTRELLADLHLHVGLVVQQRLRIGVDRDELHPREVLLDHAVDGVASTATDT